MNESLSAEIVIICPENSFVCINASAGCIFAIGSLMRDYPLDGTTSLFTSACGAKYFQVRV